MSEIRTFPFAIEKLHELREYHFGLNWPVVYIQENGKEMYIGQTTNLYGRSKQHLESEDKARLKKIHVLTDEEFNLSASFDFESLLIQYISADGEFALQNGNGGLINHSYYDKERYWAKLKVFWPMLQEKKLVRQNLEEIKNTDFFKYSPYKALTEDQLLVAEKIEAEIKKDVPVMHIVNGSPGTGKSILPLYLLKHLKEQKETSHLKVALVVPMTGLRGTLQKVMKRVPNLGADVVIGPSDVIKKQYDVLIVDEAHRLRRRVNLTNFPSYDAVNKKLNIDKNATQLDWILKSSKQQILFYDERQNIVPGDVRASDFKALTATHHTLSSQMRVEGGEDYLQFIDDILEIKKPQQISLAKYEFRVFDHIQELIDAIKKKDKEFSLARVVAGYAWPWNTAKGKSDFDIEIDGLKYIWNSTNADWVNSKNAINEIGCIHTIQGYDLNFAGVIIGPEVTYDIESNEIVIDKGKYFDQNGRRAIAHPDELKQYIINIYKTLLTRGIKGTYVYICDPALKEKIKQLISVDSHTLSPIQLKISPITVAMVSVPIVGSAPCGNPLLGEENIEEYIDVPKAKLRARVEYFILRAEGDSMNLAGIQDGDLVLCRHGEKGETGNRVVALLGDNVTIKIYGERIDGIRKLLPKSSNPMHQPITPSEGDSVQGIVQEVL